MGTAGRELIDLLNQGVAAEVDDAYRYLLLSRTASGLHAAPVADLFARAAADEWTHVALLVDRVLQLGGTPPADAAAVPRPGCHQPPADPTDLRAMLTDGLDAERATIRFYHQLFIGTRDTDPVTAELALRVLGDEISDEDDLQRLLAGWTRSPAADSSTAAAG